MPSAPDFGPYRLERELGRGAHAVVHLARDTRLARLVALKIFPAEFAHPAWLREKVRREVELTARLCDPGVCAIHDSGEVDGRAYIAMRHVEGEALSEWSAKRPPLHEVLALLERVARTVHRAHEQGIVHGDLKPANLMVASDGTPVILDFGSAQEAGTGEARFRGTPAYAAPEQLQGGPYPSDRRSDVFALGVILYECLAGRRPFTAAGAEGVLRAILSEAPPPLRRFVRAVPRDLEHVLAAALEKNPDERYLTALDLAEDLRRVRAREPVAIRRAGLAVRYARWLQRRPVVAGGASLLVLLLALLLVNSLRLLHSERAALAALRRYSDLRAASNLVERARARAWPLTLLGLAEMEGWSTEARALLARREAYGGDRDPQALLVRAELDTLHEQEALVEAERARSVAIARESLVGHQERWEDCLTAIADVRANPSYEGLRLVSQEGLVPLGRDRESRLFEFAHLASGAAPERDPASGKLRMGADSGLVLVLLPHGKFRMGAVAPGPGFPLGEPNVDPLAEADEAPLRTVELDPFFLSKYELSNAQWRRLGQSVPSPALPNVRPDEAAQLCRTEEWSLYPVSEIPRARALRVLTRIGLSLPTEAQLEYGIRGGTSRPWWAGDGQAGLQTVGLFLDPRIGRVFGGIANPFGLLHVHDLATEMTLEPYGAYTDPIRAGDGLRLRA